MPVMRWNNYTSPVPSLLSYHSVSLSLFHTVSQKSSKVAGKDRLKWELMLIKELRMFCQPMTTASTAKNSVD